MNKQGTLTSWLAVAVIGVGCAGWAKDAAGQTAQTEQGKPVESLRVAVIGEPPTFDAHHSTALTAQTIAWHIYEGLFTVDKNFNAVPMLAEGYSYDEASKTYVIRLRSGIKFHDGSDLDADDVLASLDRWSRKSNYGRLLAGNIKEIRKKDALTVEIELKQPSPIVQTMLSFPNQQAAIYPKEIIDKYKDAEVREHIGTGPYRLAEHLPDRHIKLVRYDGYKPLPGPPDGMAGARVAYASELLFIPTPEVSVRLDGVQTGLFDIAEQVSSDMYDTVTMSADLKPVITKPYQWSMPVFNKKAAPFNNVKARQAFVVALKMQPILEAAFASKDFYRLDPSILFKEQGQWWTTAGSDPYYDKGDVERAKTLLAESGYRGEPIRWLTTKEYDFMYKNALVAADQLKKVGFNIDLQVVDWATIVQKRGQPDAWEIFSGGTTFTPDPGIWPIFDSKWPGFWEDPKKDALVQRVNTEMDLAKRKAAWEELHAYFWEQVPVVKLGDFFLLGVTHGSVKGLQNMPFPFYWNVWKD
jgi:peptide/nickel transport system substrate-binding protein